MLEIKKEGPGSVMIETMYFVIMLLKGTVSVISSDPPCKDGNA